MDSMTCKDDGSTAVWVTARLVYNAPAGLPWTQEVERLPTNTARPLLLCHESQEEDESALCGEVVDPSGHCARL
jgi:hypothetical protein